MSNTLYELVIDYVDTSYGRHIPHFERTVFWLEKFLPNFGEAERIAAYSHDIERAFRDETKKAPEDYLNFEFLRNHQEGGAEIMRKFLTKNNASNELIETVLHLISRHEEGGDMAQNALMDADSVSFFETNVENFVRKKVLTEWYEKVKPKIEWMYHRISSDMAREEAKKNYEYWVNELEKVK